MVLEEYSHGIKLADDQLAEQYYGSMCPGALEALSDDPESLFAEYKEWSPILEPIIAVYQSKEIVKGFIDLLDNLRVEDPECIESVDEGSRPSLDLFTLPLPFKDND